MAGWNFQTPLAPRPISTSSHIFEGLGTDFSVDLVSTNDPRRMKSKPSIDNLFLSSIPIVVDATPTAVGRLKVYITNVCLVAVRNISTSN